MGFSISWIAFHGLPRAAVLARTKFEDTGEPDEVNETPFSVTDLPDGWTLIFANNFNWPKIGQARLWSRDGATVVSCRVEEHVMVSTVQCAVNGVVVWSATHNSPRGIYDLDVRGTPPPQFQDIRARLIGAQDAAGGQRADVDYVFDVPVELAASVTGFRHDVWSPEQGEPGFTALAKAKR